jgi:hypothetical protein
MDIMEAFLVEPVVGLLKGWFDEFTGSIKLIIRISNPPDKKIMIYH